MLGTGCLAIDVPLIQGGRISDLHPEKAFHMKNHWRTSVFLITTILLILASAFSGCGRSPEARRNRYLEAGKKMLAQKDYDRAIIEFKNAVSAMPKDPESHYQLAVASVATGKVANLQTAILSLRRALELDPKHAGARLELAKLKALASDPRILDDAEKSLKALLDDSAATPDALNVLAMTQLKLGKTGDAIQNLERALVLAPQDFSSTAMLVTARLAQRDVKGAEELLQKAVKESPNSADLILLLGRVYLVQGKLAEAEAQFKRAIEVSPKNQTGLVLLGDVQLAQNHVQDAEQTYKQLTALGDKETKNAYALFLFDQGRRDEAIRELERQARAEPTDRQTRTRLVAAYYAVNRIPDANKLLEAVLKKNPQDMEALTQQAELRIQTGEYNKAESDLNQVLRLSPESAEIHYLLAQLHRARGSDLSYRQELTEALRIQPFALNVRLELAQVQLATNAARTALQLLDEAPPRQKTSPSLLVQRNWALWSLGDLAQMRKGIDQGLTMQPQSPEFLVQDGYWKLQARDFKGAAAAFEASLRLSPDYVLALDGLNKTYVVQKQGPQGLQKVRAYAAQRQASAPVQEFVGKLLLENGDLPAARVALSAAKAAAPNSFGVDLSLVQLDISENKTGDAVAKLNTIVSKDPRNSVAYLWLGNLAETKGDHGAAMEQYRKAVEANPRNSAALNNLAYGLTAYQNKPDESLKYAQQAKELVPDSGEYADTLAWVLYSKGLYDQAVKELESAAKQQDAKPTWKYHLGMAYLKAGNRTRGRATLEAALKQSPNAPEAKAAKDLLDQTK